MARVNERMDRREFINRAFKSVAGGVAAAGLGAGEVAARQEKEKIKLRAGSELEERQKIPASLEKIVNKFADNFMRLCAGFDKSITASELVGAVKVTEAINSYFIDFAKARNVDPQRRTRALEKEALASAQIALLKRSNDADMRVAAAFSGWILWWNEPDPANRPPGYQHAYPDESEVVQ